VVNRILKDKNSLCELVLDRIRFEFFSRPLCNGME
jgi:hypothetical protein